MAQKSELLKSLENSASQVSTTQGAISVVGTLLSGGWLGLALQVGIPAIIGVVKDWAGDDAPTPDEVREALSEMRKEDPLDVDALLANQSVRPDSGGNQT